VTSALWPADMCPAPLLSGNLDGLLAPPLAAFAIECVQSLGGPITGPAQLAVAHVHVKAGSTIKFHMLTWADPDNAYDFFATGTLNTFSGPGTQVSTLTCTGPVCGPVVGSFPWDLIVDTQDTDHDGYSDLQETAMGKDPNTYCNIMRADVDMDGAVTILDLSRVARDFGKPIPPAAARNDQDDDGMITILDLSRQAAVFGKSVMLCP
jgi:hypothetical protein